MHMKDICKSCNLELFFNKFNINLEKNNIFDNTQFYKFVSNRLSKENIILASTDRYYLSYLEKKYERAHFGMHLVSISGLNKQDTGIYYAVNDVISDEIIWC